MTLAPTSSRGSSGGGAGGAVTQISSTALGGAGTFDVSGISQAYNDLLLVLVARGTRAAFSEDVQLRFNADSGNNYFKEQLSGVTTTPTAIQSGVGAQVSSSSGVLPAASSPANSFGVWACTVYGYASTTWLKSLVYDGFGYDDPGSGSQIVIHGGGVWTSTAAITRVQIQGLNTANLVTASLLRIYGVL